MCVGYTSGRISEILNLGSRSQRTLMAFSKSTDLGVIRTTLLHYFKGHRTLEMFKHQRFLVLSGLTMHSVFLDSEVITTVIIEWKSHLHRLHQESSGGLKVDFNAVTVRLCERRREHVEQYVVPELLCPISSFIKILLNHNYDGTLQKEIYPHTKL